MIYLSGAISNDPNYMDKFGLYHELLSKLYHKEIVYNPAIECKIRGLSAWKECMQFNLDMLGQCSRMYIIKDNIPSRGVALEITFCLNNNIPYNYIRYQSSMLLIYSNDNNYRQV